MTTTDLRRVFLPGARFWNNVFLFAIPIALQNLSASVFGIIDVAIIGKLGEMAVSAVSLSNQLFVISSLLTFGITSGASVLLSRGFGEGNPCSVRKSFAIMLVLGIIFNFIVMCISFFFPKTVMGFYTNDPLIIAQGAKNLRITAPINILYVITSASAAFNRSAGLPGRSMMVTLITAILKTTFNFLFVFGFGFIPAMSIQGVAVATLLSRFIGCVVDVLLITHYSDKRYIFRFADIKDIRKTDVGKFIHETYPVIINESVWGFGISSFNAIFGRLGNDAMSAASVAQQLENLCNAFFYGIGTGACVTISRMIGQKRFEDAKLAARRYSVVGFEVGICIMVLMLSVNSFYVNTFFGNLTQETRRISCNLIVVYALYMPFRSFASSMIMGSLRAGGDGKKAMYYDILPIYLWSLPVGFLTGIVLKQSVVIVLAVMHFKRVIKSVFAIRRVLSDKWIHIEMHQEEAIAVNSN